MKAYRILLAALCFLPVASFAQETQPLGPVLALAPADALGIAYLSKPDDIFGHAIWDVTGATENQFVANALKASAAAFTGPTMIAVCGSPLNPASIRVEFATQPTHGADAFFAQLHDALMPALGKLTMDPAAGVQVVGAQRMIRLPNPLPMTIFAAEKAGMIYGSSRPQDVTAWLAGQEFGARFATSAAAGKLPRHAGTPPDAFMYVDCRPLMPLAGMEMQRLFPGLFASLGLDKLEFAALSAQWSQGASSVDVTIATAQGNEAFLDFLAARNAPLEIASLVPDDYAFFVRGSMTSAADAVNRLNGILGVIDPEIVAEFQQECAEFRTDVGFDPLQDLLGNLVEEWIVAAKFDANGKPVGIAAVRMGDPAKFQRHAENLIRAFNLKVESQPCGDTVIYSAPAETGIHLAWATLGNHLLLSDCAASIVDIVKRPALAPDVAVAHAWTGIMPHFAAETARFAFVNIAPLARLAVEEVRNEPEAAEFLPILQQLAESSAGIGLAVTRGDASVNIRIAANEAVNRSVRDLAWKSVAVSTNRARMLARRTVSAANIRNIIYGCMIYANDHKNAWPDNFAVLWQAGAVAPQSFVAPHDMCLAVSAENVDEVSSYLYRPGTKLQASEVVVCERQLQESGANFGFADGHVEWISGPRAEELLADMQRTAAR